MLQPPMITEMIHSRGLLEKKTTSTQTRKNNQLFCSYALFLQQHFAKLRNKSFFLNFSLPEG